MVLHSSTITKDGLFVFVLLDDVFRESRMQIHERERKIVSSQPKARECLTCLIDHGDRQNRYPALSSYGQDLVG